MKILITGAKWHDNSPAIASDGFGKLGHQTGIFYDNFPDWAQKASRIFTRTPFRKQIQKYEDVYRGKVAAKFSEIVAEYKPDFIFAIAGLRFPGEIIRRIREEYKIPIANFVVDDPAFCSRTLMHDLADYSEVFVIDKDWMPVLEHFNPGHIHYLPHAGDSMHFKPFNLKKDVDIAFGGALGLRMPNGPAGYLRAEILNTLAEAGFKIKAYSGGITETFKEFPALKKIDYYDGYKNHDELNELYNRAKIVLSIHSPQLKAGVSPRVFDIALAGAFQLAEYKPDMPELFPRGTTCFKNKRELLDLAKHYLENSDEREKMAKEAHEHALARHTFKSRAEEVLGKIK